MKLFSIIFILFVSCAEIDICIPSFAEIKTLFDLSAFKTEMILTINLLCHCIGAIFVGSLGDRYGKKKVITAGLLTFILGSLVCTFANSFEMLILGRVLQGFGVSAPMVLTIIFVFDIFAKEKQVEVITITNGVTTLAVCFAPIIGSYVDYWFDWHMNFAILLVFGIIALLLHLYFIPKDNIVKDSISSTTNDASSYFKILCNKTTALYIIALCMSAGSYYTFVSMAPIVYMQDLGVNLKDFGFYQTSLTLAFGFFSIVISRIRNLIGSKICTIVSIALIVIFLLLNLIFIFYGISDPLIITIAMLCLSIGFVYPGNTLYAVAMQRDDKNKGKISALITIIKWLVTVIGVQTASFFYNDNFKSTATTIAIMTAISILLIVTLLYKDSKLYQELLHDKQS